MKFQTVFNILVIVFFSALTWALYVTIDNLEFEISRYDYLINNRLVHTTDFERFESEYLGNLETLQHDVDTILIIRGLK